MGWLKDLDAAIQARLEAVQVSGRRVVRTVGPLRAQGRSPVPEEMLSADKPAVFYAIEQVGGDGEGVLVRVRVLLLAEGLRGSVAAWRGSNDNRGAYDLAEIAAAALIGLDFPGTAGAWLVRQRLANADERVVALSQEYEVLAAGQRVLVDGADVLGSRSIVGVQHSAAAQVVLAGTLWAQDETTLAGIETALDALVAAQQARLLAVGAIGSWPGMTLKTWKRTAGRAARPMLGLVGQAVQMEFEPYMP